MDKEKLTDTLCNFRYEHASGTTHPVLKYLRNTAFFASTVLKALLAYLGCS
jgi:hypothetical protein